MSSQGALESLMHCHVESGEGLCVADAVDDPQGTAAELGEPETHSSLLPLMEPNVLQQRCRERGTQALAI